MKKLNSDGFGLGVVLLLVVILGGAGFAGWSVYSSQQTKDNGKSSNTSQNNSPQTENSSQNETSSSTKKGTFKGVGTKTGSGSVSLERNADGAYVVRLDDDFVVQKGPALYVGFGNNGNVDHNTLFAELKSFDGKQEYVVPSSVNVEKYTDVIIYCKEFSVAFSVAALN